MDGFSSIIRKMKSYNAAKKIVTTLHDSGFITYFAGGWVRDHLLKKDADDIDIATTATPEEIIKIFPKTIPVGINFSIIIVVEDGIHCEVATFRGESDYIDGRRPETVFHVTPQEDAHRRDFTINGMFYDPIHDKVYDYVGGEEDLHKKIIRAIGNPHKRFAEDRLRMIRACRYSSRFSFAIEPSTADAIINHASELLPSVSIERIYDEFRKMTKDPHLFDALLLMHQFGLLQAIFKGQPLIPYDILEKKLHTLPKYPKDTFPTIYLYELFDGLCIDKKISLCKFLKVSNKEIEFTTELEKWMASSTYDNYDLVKIYSHEYSDKCQEIASIHVKDDDFLSSHNKKKKNLRKHIKRMVDKKPLITSSDLIKLGIKKGKELGVALKKAEKLAINSNLDTKEEVIQMLNSKN